MFWRRTVSGFFEDGPFVGAGGGGFLIGDFGIL